jgi:hypothetical protein
MSPAGRGDLWREFPELADVPNEDLPRLWAAVVDRMATVDLIRGLGSVPAEVAERLVADYLNGQLAPRGARAYDVIADDGRRVQVKALRMTDVERNTVGNFPDRPDFELLVIVRFHYDMTPLDAWEIDADRLPVLLTKGGRLTLTKRVFDTARCVTAEELGGP